MNRRRLLISILVLLPVVGVGWLLLAWRESPPPRQPVATKSEPPDRPGDWPIVDRSDGYVGSDACRSCHPREHATWHASYHRTMTQLAAPEAVLGDFVNAELPDSGLPFDIRLGRTGDRFSVEMEGGGLGRRQYPVVLTTGSHHMQAYWFQTDETTKVLTLLPYVYLREADRWVSRRSAFIKPPQREPENEVGRWNLVCIQCHTTNGRTRAAHYDDPNSIYYHEMDTQVSELGISCEACHGPGQRHVGFHSGRETGGADSTRTSGDETIVNPRRLSHRRASQVCGQCHSVFEVAYDAWEEWNEHGHDFRPGRNLEKTRTRHQHAYCCSGPPTEYERTIFGEADARQQFWSDGVVRVRGREYCALVNNPCFQRGEMSCLSCHQLHQSESDDRPPRQWADDQLQPTANDNRACTQCHTGYRDEAALRQHTHHPVDSAGSACYNCHMPYTTYGLLKAIRSHQIEMPRVSTTRQTGRPHACNLCHLDRTIEWTADRLADWYGHVRPQLAEDERNVAASVSMLLQGDASQRALIAWSFGWEEARQVSGTDWMAPFLVQLLDDPYDAVRYIAQRSLRRIDGFQSLRYDFLGTGAERAAAQADAMTRWRNRDRSSTPRSPTEVLIDERGELIRPTFERLLKNRDDFPISLSE